MHYFSLLPVLVLSVSTAVAQDIPNSYAPVDVDCPADIALTRPVSEGLHPDEERWLHNRKVKVAHALPKYLRNAKMADFDIDTYLCRLRDSDYGAVPAIGVAISGGGYASAFMGAGVIRTLDGREKVSNEAGTGGLLQALSFFSGQSGGSWVVSSYSAAEFPRSEELLKYWQPQLNRFTATTNGTHAATFESMFEDIAEKAEAGFDVGVADIVGRFNSYEFIPGQHGGVNVTLSGIKDLNKFKHHDMPLPIIQISRVTDNDPKQLGLLTPTSDSLIYDMTPYEFGSWLEPSGSFANMAYLGTSMVNGKPVNTSSCVRAFDRISWVMGASADAYNFWWLENHSNNTLGQFPKRSTDTKTPLRKRLDYEFPAEDVAALGAPFSKYFNLTLEEYTYARIPNPFKQSAAAAPSNITSSPCKPTSKTSISNHNPDTLNLLDATEVSSSLPLIGQLARNASFILAWDDGSDAFPNGWENGTNLYQAYQYFAAHDVPFPTIPSPSTFIARNYTQRPTFFGCNASLTTSHDTRAPIIAYLPNAPYSSYSNISFFDNVTPASRVRDLWQNTFDLLTQGAGKLDSEWSACLACAAVDRSLTRLSPAMQRTPQCERCFERYCWDGVEAPDQGHVDVDLQMALKPGVSFELWNETVGSKFQ